jgi:putative peptide zinc metalloprotease protein
MLYDETAKIVIGEDGAKGDCPMNSSALVETTPRIDHFLVYVETAPGRYVVKQPETGRYFRLSAQMVQVMQFLDGTKTIDEISHQFHLKPAVVQDIVDQLVHLNLLEQEYQQEARDKPKKSHVLHTRPFFVHWDIIASSGWIDRVYAILRLKYVFRPWLCIALLILYSVACVMYLLYGRGLRPAIGQLSHLSAATLSLLVTVTLFSAMLHELAHAFTCRHFGGKARSLGIGFYFFFPVLYADVTDAWLFTKRHQRLFTHAAGLLMNFFLASVALLLLPLALHHNLFLKVIAAFYLTSFLYTLVNFNPLIKLDGYFLLADALGIENMRDKAMKTLLGSVGHIGRRLRIRQATPLQKNKTLPRWEKAFLRIYALLSLLYIGFLLLYMPQVYVYLLALYLGRWSQIIVIGVFTSLIIIPLWKTGKSLKSRNKAVDA